MTDYIDLKNLERKAFTSIFQDGFFDIYSITFSDQKKVFVSVIEEYTKYPSKTIYSWI